jgi:long-chain acyl-CoA synthetase
MFEQAMQRFADKPAIRCFDQTLTYAETDRLSRNFTAYLQSKLGVAKGDRIAVMLPNIPAFALAMLGIVRAGAVQVNVNPLYSPRELEHQLNDAGVETIVIFSGSSSTLADVITGTRVKNVVTVNLGDGTGASLTSPPVDSRLNNCVAFSDAVAQGANLPFKSVPVRGEDLLFLQYTGGTTGVSKGAALSHRNLVANTEQFKAFIPDALRPGQEVVVTALPLYHIFALMVNFISCYSIGAENWFVPNPRDMNSFVEILSKARPTIFTGVNTLFGGLLMQPKIADVDFCIAQRSQFACSTWPRRQTHQRGYSSPRHRCCGEASFTARRRFRGSRTCPYVRLDATERPDLELLGEQLPARECTACFRHSLLEQ